MQANFQFKYKDKLQIVTLQQTFQSWFVARSSLVELRTSESSTLVTPKKTLPTMGCRKSGEQRYSRRHSWGQANVRGRQKGDRQTPSQAHLQRILWHRSLHVLRWNARAGAASATSSPKIGWQLHESDSMALSLRIHGSTIPNSYGSFSESDRCSSAPGTYVPGMNRCTQVRGRGFSGLQSRDSSNNSTAVVK